MTIIVSRDERYLGSGSKETTVSYTGTSTVLQVQQSFDWDSSLNKWVGDWSHSALIENLVIDGLNQPGTTGILLENVVHCYIRNLTIKNCDVGIRLHNNDKNTGKALWTEVNHIEHVRMSNVKTGILFSRTQNGGDSFAFTKIDDVDISLKNDANAVGIQVGDGTNLVKPYSSSIKATVKLQSAGGTGLKVINGELKYGLNNLAVKGSGAGKAVDLTNAGNELVYKNQSFFLHNGGAQYSVYNPNNYINDIAVRP